MKKIVILLFAVLVQAVYVFGEELARELARECAKGGMVVLPDASHARIKTAFEKRIAEIRGTANMLVCCSPWGHKASDTTKQMNNNKPFSSP